MQGTSHHQRAASARRRVAALVAVAAMAWPLGGCGDEAPPTTAPATTAPHASVPADVATTDDLVYFALGDSLSRGVEPDPSVTLRRGYPRTLAARLEQRSGQAVVLVEAGCGGAVTLSFIEGGRPCPPDAPVPYANRDPATSQLAWAEDQLRARGDRPTLVTLSLGANDVIACANDDPDRIRECIGGGRDAFEKRLDTIATRLANASGERTVLAVATIYDPLLGTARLGTAPLQTVAVFHAGIVGAVNPAIREHFAKAGWKVADLGRAVDEQAPLDTPSSKAIDGVCRTTWACTPPGDIHLNEAGYALSGRLHERAVADSLRAIGVALDR